MMAFFMENRNMRFTDLLKSVRLPPNGAALLSFWIGYVIIFAINFLFFSLINCFTVNAQNEPNSMEQHPKQVPFFKTFSNI